MHHSTKITIALLLLLQTSIFAAPRSSFAAEARYTASAQIGAFAPNAGGQEAYALRLGKANWEAGIFSNQYILAGNKPLTGAFYDWRFPICDYDCFWRFYLQLGVGGSNGGPLAQVTWGTMIPALPLWLPTSAPRFVPAIRLDITTQFIAIRYRTVTWSYPLWVGVSLPF